ncbi:MAG: hypothetical protein H7Z14_21690 [Anaerolineae bacterium]|nr:hypothetical protein [Phycisphaerae bacterium]
MTRAWWRRRWVLASASAALILFVLFLLAPIVAKPIVRAKLQAEVDQHFRARVEIGSLSWSPLWSVRVNGFRLIANDPDRNRPFDLLSAERVSIALAGAPFGDGPIVARSIAIESPIVHLIETRDGIVGQIAPTSASASPTTPNDPAKKLSQIFRLHDLQLTSGQIIYEDRTTGSTLPLIWRDFTVQVRPVDQQSSSNYACILSAKDGRSGLIESSGAVDVDTMLVKLDHCNARIAFANGASDANSSSVPAALRTLLNECAASGELTATISGTIPLSDPFAAALVAIVEIPRASASLPDCPKPLDEIVLKLKCQTMPIVATDGSTSATRLVIRSDIERCLARSGDASVQVLGGSVAVNGAGGWGADGLRIAIDPGKDQSGLPDTMQKLIKKFQIAGNIDCTITGSGPFDVNEKTLGDIDLTMQLTPRDLSIHPPELPLAITDFGEMSVRIRNGVATVERVRAGYGQDVLFLQKASLPLADLLQSKLKVDTMKGCITFAKQQPEHPKQIQEIIAQAQPRGPFWFEGVASVDLKSVESSLDYDVRITTDRGAISTMDRRIPLLNVNTDVRVTPKLVTINRFDADVLSGKVSTTGTLKLDDMSYSTQVNVRRVDLNSLAQMSVKPGEKPITVTGELSADATLSGKGVDESAIANLKGDGAVQVIRGELFRVPVFLDVARMVNLNNLATVGEAGCRFRIGEGKLSVLEAAVGTPAMGVRATGEIDLLHEFALNLNAVATPLSDWDRQIRRDNNPAANVAAGVLGTVQKGLNNVTEELLYKVHVGGTIAEPKTELIAAPILQKK